MSDNEDGLVQAQLRLIRSELAGLKEDTREVKNRLATLEGGQGTMLQHMAHQCSSIAQLQVSFDRMGDKVERIERRLQLAESSG